MSTFNGKFRDVVFFYITKRNRLQPLTLVHHLNLLQLIFTPVLVLYSDKDQCVFQILGRRTKSSKDY